MRRILAVLFVLALVIGCGGVSKPPVTQPTCPTPQILVNGVCVDPAVPPPDEPPPPPPDDPQRPKAKVTPGDPVKLIGLYGAFSSDADPWFVAKTIYESGFTGAYIFLDAPRAVDPKNPLQAWTYRNGKFILSEPNSKYYEKLQRWIDAFSFYGLDLAINFDVKYFLTRWNVPGPHPYRNNDAGINYGSCVKCVYDGITFPTHYWLMEWSIISESKLQWKFKPANALGKAWYDRNGRIMDLFAAAKKKPENKNWRLFWKKTNEEEANLAYDSVKKEWKASGTAGVGDRSELYAMFYEMWAARGLKPNGKDFFAIVNREAFGGPAPPQGKAYSAEQCRAMKKIYTDVTGSYGVKFGHNALLEIHLDYMKDVDDLISCAGADPRKMMISTDGIPKDKNIISESQKINKRNWPYVDYIFDEEVWNKAFGKKAPKVQNLHRDFEWNFKEFYKEHEAFLR